MYADFCLVYFCFQVHQPADGSNAIRLVTLNYLLEYFDKHSKIA